MSYAFDTVASAIVGSSYLLSRPFERTREEFKSENFREYLALYQLRKALEVASTYQLALPLGTQAADFLNNSLAHIESGPLAIPYLGSFCDMDETGTVFVFDEKGKMQEVHCTKYCKRRDYCRAGNIVKEGENFVCLYTREKFYECPDCHTFFTWDRLNLVTDSENTARMICKQCRNENYIQCQYCGSYHENTENGNFAEVNEYGFVCNECLDRRNDIFKKCEDCGEWFLTNNMQEINGDLTFVCNHCARENYRVCDNCGHYVDSEHLIYSTNGEFCLCHECYDEGDYAVCNECGNIINTEEDEGRFTNYGYICSACRPNAIKYYSYKPAPVFQKTEKDLERGNLYMGIELEFSHYDERDMEEFLDYAKDALNYGEAEDEYYFKEDTSLEDGYEIVSHPRTLNSWLEEKEKFRKFFLDAEGNIREGRDGLHIHISKAGMSEIHKIRFSTFVACYKEQIKIIARRETDYATYRDKPENGFETKALIGNYDRYEAVNWTNRSTVELRIFRNTVEVPVLFACIEFAHALYQFTKSYCSLQEILKGEAWTSFIKFLQTDKRYSDLREYLQAYYENPESELASPDYAKILRPKSKHDLSLVRYCCLHP